MSHPHIGYLLHCSMTAAWHGSVHASGLSLSHRLPAARRVALVWPARSGRRPKAGRVSRGVAQFESGVARPARRCSRNYYVDPATARLALAARTVRAGLSLHPHADINRRVLAVFAYLRNWGGTDRSRSRPSAVAQLMPSF